MVGITRATGTGRMFRRVGVAGASIVSVGLGVLLLRHWRFNRLVRRDVAALFDQQSTTREDGLVTEEMLGGFPEPVQRYLRYACIVGKAFVRTVSLERKGALYLGASQGWVPLDTRQHYTVEPPGFVWDATIHKGPLPIARGRDMSAGGKGHMLIRAGSLFTVVDDRGPEMDQGSLMRYLSEMIWFPTTFLGDNVAFEEINGTSARVTLSDGGKSVSATMSFDIEGRFTNFVTKRYRTVEEGYDLETWAAPAYEYGELAGLRLPLK